MTIIADRSGRSMTSEMETAPSEVGIEWQFAWKIPEEIKKLNALEANFHSQQFHICLIWLAKQNR